LWAPEHDLPPERRFTVIHGGQTKMLDHILLSPGLHAHHGGLEIHNEGLGDEGPAARAAHPPPQSFHAPVVASFN
jgi:hypothetical protein